MALARAAVPTGAPSILLRPRLKELHSIMKTLKKELWEGIPDEARQME